MATLRKFCGPTTELEFGYPASGTTFKQNLTWRDFEKIIPEYMVAAQVAEKEGCDAVMIHCVYDPGYAEIRSSAERFRWWDLASPCSTLPSRSRRVSE